MLWQRERIEVANSVAHDSGQIAASGRVQEVWLCTVGLERRSSRDIPQMWPLRYLPRYFGVCADQLLEFGTRLQHRDLYLCQLRSFERVDGRLTLNPEFLR
jgi:hypothetical protein